MDNLDQLHPGDGIKKMDADQPLRLAEVPADIIQRNTRGIGCQYCVSSGPLLQLPE